MSPNAFSLLSLPNSLGLTRGEIDNAWRIASQQHHPDARPSEVVAIDLINEARARLAKPVGRLEEWLRSHEAPLPPRSAALSRELMTLFSSVNAALGTADDLLRRHRETSTALARSLLLPQSIQAQKLVQEQLGEITRQTTRIEETDFAEFEREAEENDFQKANQTLGKLKFLGKWERECQQRLVELIALI